MKVATKILIPTVGLSAVIVMISVVAIGLQREIASAARESAAANAQMSEAGEVRSLSRAMQRETLKVISPAWSAGREGLVDAIDKGGNQLLDRAKALVDIVDPADSDMKEKFVALQQKVVTALVTVKNEDVTGEVDRARADFQRIVPPADADASALTDTFIDSATKRVATLSAASARIQTISLLSMLGVSAFSLLVGLGSSLIVVSRGVTNPLLGLLQGVRELSGGNYNVAIPSIDRQDEIGEIATAIEHLRQMAGERRRMAAEKAKSDEEMRRRERIEAEGIVARADEQKTVVTELGRALTILAHKDLTHRITTTLPEAYSQLQTDFVSAVAQLRDAFQSISKSTDTVSAGTREIASAADNLARRTEQQASGIEEAAGALGEITKTVSETAHGAKLAREVVTAAREDANSGAEVVRRAVVAMSKIEKSSQEIGQIIGVIDEIAFQTNLLALNAGVEAARAGEAGRGFAVVASEVRALAQRSAEAAKEIKSLISIAAMEVDEGVKLVAQSGAALQRIETKVVEVNGVVGEIAARAGDQATGLQQVALAVAQVDRATQQNAAFSEELTAASRTLVEAGVQLTGLIGQFRISTREGAESASDGLRVAQPKPRGRSGQPAARENAA